MIEPKDSFPQESLPRSDDLFRGMINLSPNAVVVTDFNTNIIVANIRAAEMVGHESPDAMVAVSSLEFIAPEDRQRAMDDLQNVLELGTVRDLEYTILRVDGSRVHADIRASVIEGQDGVPQALLVVVRDITERKQWEQAVRESEEQLRFTLDAAGVGAWNWDVQNNKVHWSDTLEVIHGIPKGSFDGTIEAFERDIHPDDRERALQNIRLALEQGGDYYNDYRIVRPDGSIRWVEARGKVVCDSSGQTVRMSGICMDMTERKLAEDELLRRQHEFRALVENNPDLIARFDRDVRYLYVNPATEKYAGMPADEITGKTQSELGLPPASIALWKKYIEHVFETGEEHNFESETRWPRPGQYLTVRLVPEYGENGEVVSVLVISRDITERHRAEKRLERIYNLSSSVSRATSIQEICAEALEGMRESLDADRAAVLLLDDGGVMRFTHWSGLSDGYRRAAEGHSPWPKDAKDPQPVLVPDVEAEPTLAALQDIILGEGIRSLAFIPLAYEGQLMGKVMIYYNAPHHFTDDEVLLARSLSSQIAFAIDRQRTDEELRRRVEEMQTLLDVAPVGIGIATDTEGRYIQANRAFAEMLRIRPEDNASKTAPPEEMPAYRLLHNGVEMQVDELPIQVAAARGIDVTDVELDVVHQDGTIINLVGNAAPLFDEKGLPRGSVGAFMDITERKQREEANRLLAELDTVLAGGPDVEATLQHVAGLAVPGFADWATINLVDEYGRIQQAAVVHSDPEKLRWAEELRKRYPTEPDAPYGTPNVLRTGKPELYPIITDDMLMIAAQDEMHLVLLRLSGLKSGMTVPLKARGRILGTVVWAMDSSGRTYDESDVALAEELANRIALALDNARLYHQTSDQRAELQAIIDNIVEGVLSVDRDMRVRRVNSFAAGFLGVPAEAMIGKPIEETLHFFEAEDRPFDVSQSIRECIFNNSLYQSEDLLLRNRVGDLIPVALTVTPERSDGQVPSRAVVMFRDIAEQRALEEMRENIISVVSHELRTPLNTIKASSSTLLIGDVQLDEEVKQDFIQIIDRQADRLTSLVNDLLYMSRLQHGMIPLEREWASPQWLVDASLKAVVTNLTDHDVSAHVECDLPDVFAEPSRIEQVLVNLLDNAAKYSPRGSEIRVGARRQGEDILFFVSDNGEGIPQESQNLLFRRFTRIENTFTPRASGVGLGLAICKAIVEAHGGKIWVESASGAGSVFYFTLSAADTN